MTVCYWIKYADKDRLRMGTALSVRPYRLSTADPTWTHVERLYVRITASFGQVQGKLVVASQVQASVVIASRIALSCSYHY